MFKFRGLYFWRKKQWWVDESSEINEINVAGQLLTAMKMHKFYPGSKLSKNNKYDD